MLKMALKPAFWQTAVSGSGFSVRQDLLLKNCCHLIFFLLKVKIRNISPLKNSPNPSNRKIVLIGCPNLVVQANAFKSQPKTIAPIENIIFLFFVNESVYYIKINVFML